MNDFAISQEDYFLSIACGFRIMCNQDDGLFQILGGFFVCGNDMEQNAEDLMNIRENVEILDAQLLEMIANRRRLSEKIDFYQKY